MKVENVSQLKRLVADAGMELDEAGNVSQKPAKDLSEPLLAAIKGLADTTNQANAGNRELLERVVEIVQRPVPVEVPKPKRWVFTVERGDNDLMTRVVADAE
jgi:hypothetical protein